MRLRTLAAAAALAPALAALSPSAAPAADGTSFRIPVQEGVLSNGMKLLVVERHEAPTVSCVIRFRVGSVDERTGQTGIAHILEHMLFKGTDAWGTKDYAKEKPLLDRTEELYRAILDARRALPIETRRHTELYDEIVRLSHALAVAAAAPAERRDGKKVEELQAKAAPLLAAGGEAVKRVFDLEAEFCRVQEEAEAFVVDDEDWAVLERNGAWGLNATTADDGTQYFYSIPANRLELWALIESGRMRHPVFRQFYKERDVIMEERRMRTDDSAPGKVQEQLHALAFNAHPYTWPTIGWASDISVVSRTQVEAFFREHYAPNRAVACVVGDVKFEQVKALMERYFGDIPRQPDPEPVVTVEPAQGGEKRAVVKFPNLKVPQVTVAYHRPAVGHPDFCVLDVINGVLTSGRSGRLDRVFWEKRTGQFGAANPDTLYPDLFLFFGTPIGGKTLADAEKEIAEQVRRLKEEPVTDEELLMVRNQAAAGLVRSMQSNMGLARNLASFETLLRWDYMNAYPDAVAKVTKEDIQRVARKYFSDDNRTVIQLVPAEPAGK